MSLTELKIKTKTLAAEARFLRLEQCKWLSRAQKERIKQKAQKRNEVSERGQVYEAKANSLYRHNKDVVRPEARACNIARAWLRGKPLEFVERSWYENSYALCGVTPYNAYKDFWYNVGKIAYRFSKDHPVIGKMSQSEIVESVLLWRDQHPLIKKRTTSTQFGMPLRMTPRSRKTSLSAEERAKRKEAWNARASSVSSD